MGVIVDDYEEWRCRDCGAFVMDETIRRRLQGLLFSILQNDRETLEARAREAETGALLVRLVGACAACGGGRIWYRIGKG
jgi:hypothetical protein